MENSTNHCKKIYSSSVRALKFHFDKTVILCKQTACCEKKESEEMQKLCNTISLWYWMFFPVGLDFITFF